MNVKTIFKALSAHKVSLVWSLRLLIGALFIISGAAKGLDIWGFVFKIEEYLQVWDIVEPRSLCLTAAIAIAGTEFVAGLLLLLGCYRRVSVWLLTAMMAVMLPLTLYIYIFSPVPDCGCFGDFWVISNAATFWKNVAITIALILLLVSNHKVEGIFRPYIQWIVLISGAIYFLFVSLYGYMVQPMVDFRSFPIGSPILADESEASTSCIEENIRLIYTKNGEQKTFSIDSLPDSTWTFVDRQSDIDLSAGTTSAELTLYDDTDTDVTVDVIDTEAPQLIITLPEYRRASPAYTYTINELERYIARSGGSLIEITDFPSEMLDRWRDYSMADYPIYRAESTVIKELARGTMSVVYLRDGVVVGKLNLDAVDLTRLKAVEQAGGDPLSLLTAGHKSVWHIANAVLITALLLIWLTQLIVKTVRNRNKSCPDSKKNH